MSVNVRDEQMSKSKRATAEIRGRKQSSSHFTGRQDS